MNGKLKDRLGALNPFRMLLAVMIPLVAFVLQSTFWTFIYPYVWFLFFPAVFFSSWVAGFLGGLVATILSAVIVWWYFIPPQYSFALENPMALFSIGMFVFMGVLFSISHGRLLKANRQAADALAAARLANEDLQGANKKITILFEKTKELDELKTQFFANVSHELRTPLTLILGPVANILAKGGLDGGMRRDMQVVERNARQLYRHVSDLLDVAKLEAGRTVMRFSQADLARLARVSASNFEVLAAEKNIRFTVDAPEELAAQIDVEKCQRVLLNLLSNAFKFTPDGGTITVGLKSENDRTATIQVADNGPGIPANLQKAVFERFRQVEGGAQRRYGGTGLGLSIVKNFVELHNGTIGISDNPGGGTVFTVTLPIVAPADAAMYADTKMLDKELDRQALDELTIHPDAADAPAASIAVEGPLILVVEDNRDMNSYIRQVLAPHFHVASAFDGEEGLAKALALHPALIVSDIMMPRMSGDQMIDALRGHPEMADTPIILLTAKVDDALRIKLLGKGAQEFLTKPFLDEELLAVAGRMIEEHMKVSRTLRVARKEVDRLFSLSPDLLCVISMDGHFRKVNPSFSRILGFEESEVIGRPFLDFVHPDDREKSIREFKCVRQGGTVLNFDNRYIAKGGGIRWMSWSALMDADVGQMYAIGRNITGRKQGEEKLKVSESALSKAEEMAHLGNWELDIQTGKVTWSGELYRLFGFEPGEVEPTPGLFMGMIHPEDKKAIQESIDKAISGKIAATENEMRITGRDGSERVFFTKLEVIKDDGGKPVKLAGINHDITAMKAANEKLKAAKAEAEAATLLKDKFVSLVSHDLKAPLSSMIGFLKLVKNDSTEPVNIGAELIVSSAINSGNQMARLIDDLLSISRLRTGQLKLDRQFFDAKYLGMKIVADYSRLARQKGIEIVNTIPENSRIYGDKTLLTEAIQNLATNAIKFCKSGDRVTISIAKDDVSTICIQDTGPGVRPDLLDNLFKYEKKVSTKGTAGETGTGFGLSLVKDIIEFHGGTLGIISEPGNGSLFSLKLPYVRPKILLVDDDMGFRYLQMLNLNAMNATIIEAENGEDALNMIDNIRPHLIITDIKMPLMDGLELLKIVRSKPDMKNIPVIVVSGEFGMEIRDAVFKLGGDDFATKDIDPNDFIPRVRRFIG